MQIEGKQVLSGNRHSIETIAQALRKNGEPFQYVQIPTPSGRMLPGIEFLETVYHQMIGSA